VDALLELCGDAEVVAGLIDTFLAEGPVLVARVGAAVRAGDAVEARLAAHTLKSHGLTFGAPRLARVAAQVERLARDRELAAAGGLAGELAVEFDRARDALGELRDELAGRR
jgi:HPt (histidine-containing phosphotransfer) domain-containing protein